MLVPSECTRRPKGHSQKCNCIFLFPRSSIFVCAHLFCHFPTISRPFSSSPCQAAATPTASAVPIAPAAPAARSYDPVGTYCICGSGCLCGRNMTEPTFGGLRNYNAENDCKCGPNCNCADCQCHK